MTLQQLKYVITVAETGTITEAANQLFISQPSLTNAIHELEKEMNIVIFNRTNKGIPLAEKKVITNQELEIYPYLSFEQGEHSSFYFSEEIFSESERKKNIRVRDRATLFNLLIGLNGYTVCSGVIDKKLNGSEIIAVSLADESDMRIGYITHRKGIISRLGNSYLEALMKYTTGGQNL